MADPGYFLLPDLSRDTIAGAGWGIPRSCRCNTLHKDGAASAQGAPHGDVDGPPQLSRDVEHTGTAPIRAPRVAVRVVTYGVIRMNFREKQDVRIRYPHLLAVVLSGLLLCRASRGDDVGGPLCLTMPTEFHAVVGDEMRIYYDNIVLTQKPELYRFTVACDLGQAEQRHWRVKPVADDVGQHAVKVTVADADGTMLGSVTTMLEVVAADAGAERSIRLLIVGDSLTHATIYPNEIAQLLSRPGNPDLEDARHPPAGQGRPRESLTRATVAGPGSGLRPTTNRIPTAPIGNEAAHSYILAPTARDGSMSSVILKKNVAASLPTSASSCWVSTTASVPIPTTRPPSTRGSKR